MTEREFQIYFARVCLAQSRAFSRRENTHVAAFGWVLLDMAQVARREAMAMVETVQSELFA